MYKYDYLQSNICIHASTIPQFQGPTCVRSLDLYQYVPQIADYRRLVAVNHAPQSKSTHGTKSDWRQRSGGVVVAVTVVAM